MTGRGAETAPRLAAILAIAAAALYTHYLALPVCGALLVLALLERRFRTAGALAAAGLLFLPWAPILAEQPRAAVSWMRESPGASALGFLSALGGVGRIPAPFGPTLPLWLPALGVLVGAALAAEIAAAARRDRETRAAALYVALVLGMALLASFFTPFVFAGRTEIAVLPVWIWASAHAAEQRRTARFAALAAGLLGLAAVGLLAAAPRQPSAATQASRVLDRLARPGDRLFAGPGLYLPFRLAADREHLTPALSAFPAEVADHPGWWEPAAPTAADYEGVARAAAGPGSVWLLVPPGFVTPQLRAILTSRSHVRELSLRPEAVLLHAVPGAPPGR
ncbi:MAG TPA: hypothetical protein VEG84_10550 [Thermoanaerobaculia bacterium]|nr:hypothetical protein [Thermoanaerobaculia bacterium]